MNQRSTASSSHAVQSPGVGLSPVAGAVLLVVLAVFLAALAPASALANHAVVQVIDPGGTFGTYLGDVGVNRSSGDVYVGDQGNGGRIDQYSSTGSLIRIWGGDVVRSGPDNGPNERQTLTVSATGGTFKLSFDGYHWSEPLAYDAGTGVVKAAVEALAASSGEEVVRSITVSGGPGDESGSSPYVIDFDGGAYVGAPVAQLQTDAGSLTGGPHTATVSTTVNGGGFEICEPSAGDVCKPAATSSDEVLGGEFASINGVSVDQSTGDVYVTDNGNLRVQRFGADGEFKLAFGKDVIQSGAPADSGEGFEVCEVSSECKQGVNGSGLGGEFTSNGFYSSDIAVDPSSGDVYVTDPGDQRIQEFDSSGSFLLAFGYDVVREGEPGDSGEGFEVCTVAAECKAGAGGPGEGQFGSSALRSIAVDSSGRIFAYDVNPQAGARVERFSSTPSFEAIVAPGTLNDSFGVALAEGPEDHLYASHSIGGEKRIVELDSAGSVVDTSMAGAHASNVTGLAVGSAGERIYASLGSRLVALEVVPDPVVTIDPVTTYGTTTATFSGTVDPNGGLVEYAFEYSTDGSTWTRVVRARSDAGNGTGPVPVTQLAGGLVPDTTYQVRLVAKQAYGTQEAVPQEVTFTTESAAPTIANAPTVARGTSATLAGDLRPNSSGATTYHFEYGKADCASNPCASTPAEPVSAGADGKAYVSAHVTGLEQGATYHYRLVAGNAQGTTYGPDRRFTALRFGELADGRRWEQVSPVDKNHADIYSGGMAAAGDGDGLAFKSRGSFAGQESSSAALMSMYRSRRTATGWVTEGLAPPVALLNFQNGFWGFSEDLSKSVLTQRDTSRTKVVPEAPAGLNFYLRDGGTRSFQLLNGSADSFGSLGGFVGASSDYSHILMESSGKLTPESPCEGGFSPGTCMYEWNDGTLRLASVSPSGQPMEGTAGSHGGGMYYSVDHAMSEDGERYYWSTNRYLYVTEHQTTTRIVDEPELTQQPESAVNDTGIFQAAEAAHGEKVLFTTREPLVDADKDSTRDLYMSDASRPAGERLTLISEDHNPAAPNGAEVLSPIMSGLPTGGVMGASDDLRRIYFVAGQQIVPGEPDIAGPKMYMWDDTGAEPTVTYIGTLDPADSSDWAGPINTVFFAKPSQTTADGSSIAFLSKADLTGYESNGEPQLYVYHHGAGGIECATCNPDSYPQSGYLAFEQQFSGYVHLDRQYRNLAEDGSVFFETARGLVPQDSNGRVDVYEYGHGQLSLISSGTGSNDSRFGEADPSGKNVFFTTSDRLVGWDNDQNADVYDARVGGGFPEPPPTPPACEGDACQPPPVVPNDPTPASSGFHGPGNPPAKFKKKRHRHHHRRHKRHKHSPKSGRHAGRAALRAANSTDRNG